jgi:tRNA nucleotidyltransferase (CCA-adding enzyme)
VLFRSVGVYGAEARIQGFSGYLVELLVIRYGDFASVIEEAAAWKAGLALSIEPAQHKGFDTPLVFYDPVDASRNVSSALSADSFARFVHACQEYRRAPDPRFYFPPVREDWTLSRIRTVAKERGTALLVVALDRPDLTDDNLYPQIRKTMDAIVALLSKSDFEVLDKAFLAGPRIYFAFELLHGTLPAAKKHRGPPVWIDQAANFLTKWQEGGLSEPFIEDGRWMVMIRREEVRADALLAKRSRELSVGSDMKNLEGIVVALGARAMRSANRAVLTELLDKRKPWER